MHEFLFAGNNIKTRQVFFLPGFVIFIRKVINYVKTK